MSRWSATIEIWPMSTGAGAVEDQKAAGQRQQTFDLRADDFDQASRLAHEIVRGIRTNPRVWQAHIVELRKLTP